MKESPKSENLYLDFLRYCLNGGSLYANIDSINWTMFLRWAEQQAIVGVIYEGIQKAGKDLNIDFDILMEWIGLANQIEIQNHHVNKRCLDLANDFGSKCIDFCILKGQGNALMYHNPFSRTSGDIDVLVFEKRKTIVSLIKHRYSSVHENYIHIDYPVFDNVQVEIHFWPSYMNNPLYNYRLHKWYKHQRKNFIEYKKLPNGEGIIPVPSNEFNIVYQLMHLMHHFFDEGIGLRQFVDYYFVLRQIEDPLQLLLYKGRSLKETLRYLGLWKFAGAVMYVMREVFALEEQYMIAPVDEKRGKTLLNEILKGGNFGKYSGLTQHSTGGKYFLKHWRNLHFVREYPSEALCEPIFRTWHFFWRLGHR